MKSNEKLAIYKNKWFQQELAEAKTERLPFLVDFGHRARQDSVDAWIDKCLVLTRVGLSPAGLSLTAALVSGGNSELCLGNRSCRRAFS